MMRNKTSSSLQKTYDECYLICSTAVYYEGQGNEAEALRSWRSALDQIYYHNAYRMPSTYRPKSETEKALYDSLKDMELQCKERVDLLEALKQSRQEKATGEGSDGSKSDGGNKISKSSTKALKQAEPVASQRGYIGNGSVPATEYLDISRPPALPTRPSYSTRNSSEFAVIGNRTPRSSVDLPSSSRPAAPSPPIPHAPKEKPSRSTSPDKGYTMRTTLRSSDKRDKKTTSKTSSSTSRRLERPGANKAATLAWSSLGKAKEQPGKTVDVDTAGAVEYIRKLNISDMELRRPESSRELRYDSKTRKLVSTSPTDGGKLAAGSDGDLPAKGRNNSYSSLRLEATKPDGAGPSTTQPPIQVEPVDLDIAGSASEKDARKVRRKPLDQSQNSKSTLPPPPPLSYLKEYPQTAARKLKAEHDAAGDRNASSKQDSDAQSSHVSKLSRKPVANSSSPRIRDRHLRSDDSRSPRRAHKKYSDADLSQSADDDSSSALERAVRSSKKTSRSKQKKKEPILVGASPADDDPDDTAGLTKEESDWKKKVAHMMKHLPRGVDEVAAKQIINEIVVQGDEVHWDDVAGLEVAKTALKETVVYPFLRPDLFMGLREPARGMLLFGPPGTGKTMLARAVATESHSTFFSISASSLTSKYLGESEKLVRALFAIAKILAPSIIFVDEIDSLLSKRSGNGEHEATTRIKTEFLIQWSDLQRAAAGREQSDKDKEKGDPSRVLVLAATNLPWAIDEAARRRFVRRQYIPLPEDITRAKQLANLLGHQKHGLDENDMVELVKLTDGFSGSDITALAKDAAMGPLRSLGEALLSTKMDDIRPIQLSDFKASLITIRPSVSKQGLKEYEDWAREFGERGG